jgi:hypothetical protein
LFFVRLVLKIRKVRAEGYAEGYADLCRISYPKTYQNHPFNSTATFQGTFQGTQRIAQIFWDFFVLRQKRYILVPLTVIFTLNSRPQPVEVKKKCVPFVLLSTKIKKRHRPMCVSNLKFEKLKRYARTLKRTIKIRTFLIKDGHRGTNGQWQEKELRLYVSYFFVARQ